MKAKLLIVDDGPATRALAAALEAGGFKSDIAPDASTAIRSIESESYDAILLDPMIGGRMNGFSVLSFLELDRPELVDRTFLLTALGEQTVLHTAPDLLPRLFRKPVDFVALVNAIESRGSADRRPRPAISRPHALIADDDVPTATVLAGLMEELGHATTVVENGREAMHRLAGADYTTLIVDLMMPDVDGFALLKYIEETRPALLHRVIVSTGIPDRFLAFLDAKPIRGVLHKPIALGELKRLLGDSATRGFLC